MKKLLCSTIIIIALINIAACKGKQEETKPKVITDPKELIEVKCTACHFSSRIFEKKQPVSRWVDLVNRMRSRNPEMISVEEANRIVKYLQENNSVPDEPGEEGTETGAESGAGHGEEIPADADSPEAYE
ncbi:MAG: hypothetical protein HZA78_10890 [Candidatus Schekmanbacteria bacterium]|nr:hypothetical protein [Candidatus Schekmanbacteria bacterium]